MANVIEIKKGSFLLHENEEDTEMYFVQKGSLAIYKMQEGKNVQIGTLDPGELVGEMSFLDKEPRSASVKAITDCELMVIPSNKFEKMKKELPEWCFALIDTLLSRLRKANDRIKI